MKTEHPDQRVGIFVDVSNLYHSVKNLYNGRVNYKQLIKHLVGNRKLIRAVAYVIKTEDMQREASRQGGAPPHAQGRSERPAPAEAAFFDALERAGMELRSKDLQVYPGGFKKGDWDVGLAVDAIRMADLFDVIILVTGDGDFVPLVEYLHFGKGASVEVAAFSRSASGRLKESADHFINLEDIPKIIIKR